MTHTLSRWLSASLICIAMSYGGQIVQAQQEIGFIENFALSADRRQPLAELIPGTEDYYYFHCLHYQNQGQLAESQAMLDAWRAKLGDSKSAQDMLLRQHLLSYSQNPQRTLQALKEQLGLRLDHRPPSRDRAASLASVLDNQALDLSKLLDAALAQDASLGLIENESLGLLLSRPLNPDQLRALLQRLQRSDMPGTLDRIAEELKLKDSRGFGWAPLHARLTLEQLIQLLGLVPNLIENDAFVRAYAARLLPANGSSLADKTVLRDYLQRLHSWSQSLPPSQANLKACVLGNLLRLNLSEGIYDRDLFLTYLSLPRQAVYYRQELLQGNRQPAVELGFRMAPQVQLPPVGADDELVRRYLEHFLQDSENVDAFAQFLNRAYVDRVLAETRILYGLGDPGTWYAKLSPAEQRALRDRVELRFAPQNPHRFGLDDEVKLNVELKNVEQLIVKIYEINTLNYYRSKQAPIDASLDLDGLVANAERKLQFSQPADRRHAESLQFPEMQGRGVWIVDLLGGGGRSRALVQKGQLLTQERLGDAGQVNRIVDEAGQHVPTAHIEMGDRVYQPNQQGNIILPYAEQNLTRNIILVDGDFASHATILNHQEAYALEAGFLVDRQSLVAGSMAEVVVSLRLSCNNQPISVRLLEDAKLMVTATDSDGISTSQMVETLELEDGDDLTHIFLVPQNLRQIDFAPDGPHLQCQPRC